MGGSFFCPWPISNTHRAIFGALLALMLALVGWYEARHYEPQPSAKDIASEIAKVLPVGHTQEQATEYAGLTDSQLKIMVIAHATEMRNFERKYRDKATAPLNYQIIPNMSNEEKQKSWSEMVRESEINANDERVNFHNNFLSKSKSLHLEIVKTPRARLSKVGAIRNEEYIIQCGCHTFRYWTCCRSTAYFKPSKLLRRFSEQTSLNIL